MRQKSIILNHKEVCGVYELYDREHGQERLEFSRSENQILNTEKKIEVMNPDTHFHRCA